MLKTSLSLAALIAASPAFAGATAYLSHAGSGASCTVAAPCAAMSSAVSVAGAGGEVVCLDKGNYGGVSITQSVSISCGEGLWEAPGSATITVNTPAGGAVSIEGLVRDGAGANAVGLSFIGQGGLRLSRVSVGNLGVAYAPGILFAPTATSTLQMNDVSVFNSPQAEAIWIKPQGAASANVVLRNVKSDTNKDGLFIDGSVGTGAINVSIDDSVFSNNTNSGIVAASVAGKATIVGFVKGSQITGNGIRGISANGAAMNGPGSAGIAVGHSMITGNATGVGATGMGQIGTFGNNVLLLNTTNGAFTSTIATQ